MMNKKVLVVDDSALDLQIAIGCIEQIGCEVMSATSGEEAVGAVECDRPDVVLTDLQMPGMNGLELVDELHQGYPNLPVILMTAYGSEQIAAEALRAGAASYVPKENLKQDLGEALEAVLAAVSGLTQREQVRQFLLESTSRFELGYEPGGPKALIGYLQDGLFRMNFCDETTLMRVSTVLTEAIANAIDHGNLELDSTLRVEEGEAYRHLGNQRIKLEPYRNRKVQIEATLRPTEAKFVVRDEGPGFDVSTLPDPTDPENLLRPCGRGIMLMRTFLDEVTFNDRGNEVTLIKRRPAERPAAV